LNISALGLSTTCGGRVFHVRGVSQKKSIVMTGDKVSGTGSQCCCSTIHISRQGARPRV